MFDAQQSPNAKTAVNDTPNTSDGNHGNDNSDHDKDLDISDDNDDDTIEPIPMSSMPKTLSHKVKPKGKGTSFCHSRKDGDHFKCPESPLDPDFATGCNDDSLSVLSSVGGASTTSSQKHNRVHEETEGRCQC